MDVKDLAGEYALKADEELLLLAIASKDLIPEAQAALADEMAHRGIQAPPVPQPPVYIPQNPIKIVVAAPTARGEASLPWQVLWFFLHLLIVYTAVMFLTWRLAFVALSIFRLVFQGAPTSSSFEFLVSHSFLLTIPPAFLAGLLVARFNAKAAKYVWLVPAAILVIRMAIVPVNSGSVLFGQTQPGWWTAFQYYFRPDLGDIARGVAQIRTVVPLYAAIAYSGASIVAARSRLHDVIDHAIESPAP